MLLLCLSEWMFNYFRTQRPVGLWSFHSHIFFPQIYCAYTVEFSLSLSLSLQTFFCFLLHLTGITPSFLSRFMENYVVILVPFTIRRGEGFFFSLFHFFYFLTSWAHSGCEFSHLLQYFQCFFNFSLHSSPIDGPFRWLWQTAEAKTLSLIL